MPSSSHHSLMPSGSQTSTGSPGFSANWRMGTLLRAMNSLAPTLSTKFFTTFSELAMPCAHQHVHEQPASITNRQYGRSTLLHAMKSLAPMLSTRFFTTFSELAMPCAHQQTSQQPACITSCLCLLCMLLHAMHSLAPTLSTRFFTTFSELAMPCTHQHLCGCPAGKEVAVLLTPHTAICTCDQPWLLSHTGTQ